MGLFIFIFLRDFLCSFQVVFSLSRAFLRGVLRSHFRIGIVLAIQQIAFRVSLSLNQSGGTRRFGAGRRLFWYRWVQITGYVGTFCLEHFL